MSDREEWDAEGKWLCRSFQHDSDGWLWCRYAVLDTSEKARELADALNAGAAAFRSYQEMKEENERLTDFVKRHSRQHPTSRMGEDFKRRNLEALWDESIARARTTLETLKKDEG